MDSKLESLIKLAKRLLKKKEQISIIDLMKKVKLAHGPMMRLLKQFREEVPETRPRVVRREPVVRPPATFMVRTKTYPVFEFVKTMRLPPAPPAPVPVPIRFGLFNVRVDAYDLGELAAMVQEQIEPTLAEAEEHIKWWVFIRKMEEIDRPGIFPPTYPAEVYVPKAEEEHKAVFPKRTWDILELRSFLSDRFGISMKGAMMLEYSLRDGIKYLRLRRYRVPYEISTGYGTTVSLVPPRRLMGVLKWWSHTGWGRETGSREYVHFHEINVWCRLPADTEDDRMRAIFKELLDAILESISYPGVEDVLGSWHDADFFVVATEDVHDDGEWQQLYMDEVQRSEDVDVRGTLMDHGVIEE